MLKTVPIHVADEALKHYTFKVICLCITKKPLRAFIIITYSKRAFTSRYVRDDAP